MFLFFIEIYWSVVEYYWRELNVIVKKSPISIISPICFQPNHGENCNKNSSWAAYPKISKTSEVPWLRSIHFWQNNWILSHGPVLLTSHIMHLLGSNPWGCLIWSKNVFKNFSNTVPFKTLKFFLQFSFSSWTEKFQTSTIVAQF